MNSLGSALERHAARVEKPVPDRFFCPVCIQAGRSGGIAEDQLDAFREWAHEELPENLTRFTDGEGVMCDCWRIRKVKADRILQNTIDCNLPLRSDKIGPRTFENFNTTPGTAEMVAATQEWFEGEGSPILTLVGLTGCGKTHLMEAAGRACLARGQTVRYERVGVLLDRLRHTFDASEDGNIHDMVDFYLNQSILLLDDLGMHSLTPWGEGYLTNIVEDRILDGELSMITSTNHASRDELAAVCGDRLASRLFDRHSGSVKVIVSEASDYRIG